MQCSTIIEAIFLFKLDTIDIYISLMTYLMSLGGLPLQIFQLTIFFALSPFYMSLTFTCTASYEVFNPAGRSQKVFLQFVEVDRLLELVSF